MSALKRSTAAMTCGDKGFYYIIVDPPAKFSIELGVSPSDGRKKFAGIPQPKHPDESKVSASDRRLENPASVSQSDHFPESEVSTSGGSRGMPQLAKRPNELEVSPLERLENSAGMPQPEPPTESNPEFKLSNKDFDIIKRNTMLYNIHTYLSQVSLYINYLAAVHFAGCAMIQCQIRLGIRAIITYHPILFHEELRWLTQDVVDLYRKKESLENENRNLKQDNNSWRALYEIGTECWASCDRGGFSNWLKLAKNRLISNTTGKQGRSSRTREWSQEVSALEAEKHRLRRQVTQSKRDLQIALKQLHMARAQNEQLKRKDWTLKAQIKLLCAEVQKEVDFRVEMHRLIIKAKFLIDVAVGRHPMSDWNAIDGEQRLRNEDEDVIARYNLL